MTRPRSRTRPAVLTFLGTCLFASVGTGLVSAGSETPSPEELYARIDSIRIAVEAPSAQVAVLSPDTTILWNFGVADPESGNPVTDATMFRVGSISKSFAGLAMLTLVERGLVDLDAELIALAPELPVRNPWRLTHPVRLYHLLEAGAGFVGFHRADYEPPDPRRMEIRRVVEELLIDDPRYRLDVQWPPGKFTAYHNLGPTITAYLVEEITGERYETFVREEILEPLGMEPSSFIRREVVAERLARPHRDEREKERAEAPDAGRDEDGDAGSGYRHIRLRPSGSLNSSASEMAAFVRTLLDRGRIGEDRRLLRSETIERFETPTSTVAARRLEMDRGHAINNWTSTYRAVVYHGHGGRIDRYSAYYAYAPERGTGFVYMGTRGAEGEELHYPVSAAILDYLHPDGHPQRFRKTDTGERKELTGCYELVNPRSLDQPLRHLRIRTSEGRLLLDVPSIRGAPAYTTELRRLEDVPLFRLREPRRERSSATPWADELAFATDDRGVRIAEFVSFPHDAYERVACGRAAGSFG